jgi:hypothetical protein
MEQRMSNGIHGTTTNALSLFSLRQFFHFVCRIFVAQMIGMMSSDIGWRDSRPNSQSN